MFSSGVFVNEINSLIMGLRDAKPDVTSRFVLSFCADPHSFEDALGSKIIYDEMYFVLLDFIPTQNGGLRWSRGELGPLAQD